MAKRDKQISKQLQQAGWTLRRQTGGHEIWSCPCGQHPLLTKSASVSDGRGLKNLKAFVKSETRYGGCAVDLKLG